MHWGLLQIVAIGAQNIYHHNKNKKNLKEKIIFIKK